MKILQSKITRDYDEQDNFYYQNIPPLGMNAWLNNYLFIIIIINFFGLLLFLSIPRLSNTIQREHCQRDL